MKKEIVRNFGFGVWRSAALTAAAALITTALATGAFAAGFRLPDQDAAATGMGGAFVAQADNPSAVWYNPAGISQFDESRFSAGVIAIYPVMTHENTDGTTDVSKRKVFFPVALFGTSKINDQLSWGMSITNPFGLSTNWSGASETSSVATFSRIKSINLNPNIAYKINEKLSVAAGVDYYMLQATMEKVTPFPGNPIFRLDGDGTGWGANAGILLKASDQLNFGLSYHSRVKVKVDDATGEIAPVFSGTVQTAITLPDIIQTGVSFKASDRMTVNADIEYTWWSTYDRLVLTSNVPAFNATDEKQWHNTWTFRAGGQYKLSEQWKLRAGLVYDQNPVPESHFDTRTPDSDRFGISFGTGYTAGNITFDVAYMYLKFKDRTINDSQADNPPASPNSLNGTYKSQAHLLALTMAYKF